MNRVKSTHRGFEEAFKSVPKNKILRVRQELMIALQWSIALFYYKKRGDTPIWEHEEFIIEQTFKRYRIDAWTGETNK